MSAANYNRLFGIIRDVLNSEEYIYIHDVLTGDIVQGIEFDRFFSITPFLDVSPVFIVQKRV